MAENSGGKVEMLRGMADLNERSLSKTVSMSAKKILAEVEFLRSLADALEALKVANAGCGGAVMYSVGQKAVCSNRNLCRDCNRASVAAIDALTQDTP